MGTLNQFIDDVIDEIRTVSGINFVPDDPTDSIPNWPFAPVTASDGVATIKSHQGQVTYLHNVQVGLLAPRENIEIANQVILPKLETVIEGLYTELLSSTSRFKTNIDTFDDMNYNYGPIEWEGVLMFGFWMQITGVKIVNTL